MIVYKITNKITGKSYIGQTVSSLSKRWSDHNSSKKNCTYLKRSIEKYGKNAFQIKILVRCNNIEEMNHREQYYIKLFNTLAPNGYNLESGGNNKRLHEETKLKMRKPKSEEHKKNMKLNHRCNKRMKLPLEERQKLLILTIYKTSNEIEALNVI